MDNQSDSAEVHPDCASVMKLGVWDRSPGNGHRWHGNEAARSSSPEELLSGLGALRKFNSVTNSGEIAVLMCQDGGVISYQLADQRWLHTLLLKTAFRQRIFELNLVPIQELGAFFYTEER